MRLRAALPGHHLSDDSRHLIEICLGIVGTMAGLVLGLLVASATATYNAQRDELLDVSGKVVLLDRLLAHYGPEAEPARTTLRAVVGQAIVRIWPETTSIAPQMDPLKVRGELFLDQLESLEPSNDRQRSLKPAAIALAMSVAQTRWLMYAQTEQMISPLLVILLVFWFSITFVGFGVFSPPNATVLVALGLCALAVSGAIFLTLEMYTPFQGLVQLSSAPLRDALAHLGR
jgi:hypothetical protein